MSELNLVYLMRKESRGESIGPVNPSANATPSTAATAASAPPSKAPPAPPSRDALIAAYLRRSQEFETKKNFPRAIQELRDALRMEPTSSECHSRLGLIYLKTNQATMAKIHFNKALELNPQDAVALEGKQRLEAPNRRNGTPTPDGKGAKPDSRKADPKRQTNSKGGKPDTKGGGGLFGLFGGKKK